MKPSTAWQAARLALVRLRFVGLVAGAALLAATLDDLSSLARGLLVGGHAAPAAAAPAAVYACPMHPEVVQAGPGKCPSCNMALTRREVEAVYSCPMHPEVVRGGPGRCPSCSMALTARAPVAEVYACPMHPEAVRSEPGKCPSCGMPLRRREADEGAHVALSAEQVRLGGLAMAAVEERPLTRELVALATLELDPRRVARLSTPVRARVLAVHVAAPGAPVRRGESIATLSSRELLQQGRELQRGLPEDDASFVLAKQRLLQSGLTEAQVERMRRGKDPTAFELLSPVDGVLVAADAVAGEQLMEGAAAFTVADLSRLWLVARLPEEDALAAGPGAMLRAELAAAPGRILEATVAWVGGAVEAESRTLALRAAVENPGGLLRPGMTGRARLQVPVGPGGAPVLVVPATAVVDTGLRQVVWREDEAGVLEPVPVTVTARAGALVAVKGELMAGERVVAQGAFLLSADQRLAPPPAMPGPAPEAKAGHGDHD